MNGLAVRIGLASKTTHTQHDQAGHWFAGLLNNEKQSNKQQRQKKKKKKKKKEKREVPKPLASCLGTYYSHSIVCGMGGCLLCFCFGLLCDRWLGSIRKEEGEEKSIAIDLTGTILPSNEKSKKKAKNMQTSKSVKCA